MDNMGSVQYHRGINGEQDERGNKELFETVVGAVVNITVYIENDNLVQFSGTYIDREMLLTSNQMLPTNFNYLIIENPENDPFTLSRSDVVIHRCGRRNLALIIMKNKKEYNKWVTFADEDEIKSGIMIRIVSHRSENMQFSIIRGTVTYLCDYDPTEVFSRFPPLVMNSLPEEKQSDLENWDKKLPLIEFKSGCEESCIGAPVFNKYGRMIGMYMYRNHATKFEYAIHVNVVKNFLEECRRGNWIDHYRKKNDPKRSRLSNKARAKGAKLQNLESDGASGS